MKALAAVMILGLFGAGVVSARSPQPASSEQLQASRASAVLSEYLAAIHDRSCSQLVLVSARSHDQAQCERELHEFIERNAEFTTVSQLTRDGRSAHTWLATAKLRANGRQRDVVLRVVDGPRGWRVQT